MIPKFPLDRFDLPKSPYVLWDFPLGAGVASAPSLKRRVVLVASGVVVVPDHVGPRGAGNRLLRAGIGKL